MQKGTNNAFMNNSQFNTCVDKYSDALYRFVVGIVHNTENAQDIVQESFTRLWEHRKDVEPNKDKSYLFTVAYNLAISIYRTQKRHPQTEYCTANLHYSPKYSGDNDILWGEIDKLPLISRSLIMLCDWEGYSYEEIAQITNLNVGQVKTKLYLTRQLLRKKLQIYYDQQFNR